MSETAPFAANTTALSWIACGTSAPMKGIWRKKKPVGDLPQRAFCVLNNLLLIKRQLDELHRFFSQKHIAIRILKCYTILL